MELRRREALRKRQPRRCQGAVEGTRPGSLAFGSLTEVPAAGLWCEAQSMRYTKLHSSHALMGVDTYLGFVGQCPVLVIPTYEAPMFPHLPEYTTPDGRTMRLVSLFEYETIAQAPAPKAPRKPATTHDLLTLLED